MKAFVGLLNALIRVSGSAIPAQGRPYAHMAQFVRAEVLGQLHQRAYRCIATLGIKLDYHGALLLSCYLTELCQCCRDESGGSLSFLSWCNRQQRQKWELAEVALDHLRLCLRSLNATSTVTTYGSAVAPPLTSQPPGVIVMMDLLGEGPLM